MIYGLNDRIRELRVQKNLTQAQIAERLGITKNAVNSWEKLGSSPSLKHVAQLAGVFGVSTDYLLGVEQRLTLDVTKLDEQQREAVQNVISTFEKTNSKIK
jgi:transcriptional regulator with XRE-family HTH domain